MPELIGPRKKTTPIFILLAGITIVVAAAFIRENMERGHDAKRGVPPYQVEAAPLRCSSTGRMRTRLRGILWPATTEPRARPIPLRPCIRDTILAGRRVRRGS